MLNELENYFRNIILVEKRYLKYYINWIKIALDYSNKELGDFLTKEDVRNYFKKVSLKEEWRIKQAEFSFKKYNLFINYNLKTDEEYSWAEIVHKLKDSIRLKNFSHSTEKTYLSWIDRFSKFLDLKIPKDVTKKDLELFLTYLATKKNVSPSTQNQAMNAILYLYKNILGMEFKDISAIRAKENKSIPVVLSQKEVRRLIKNTEVEYQLIISLIYGTGLRLTEALSLRVKDIDIERETVTVYFGKGGKSRILPFPENLKQEFIDHLKKIEKIYLKDREKNILGVELPYFLEKKYKNVAKEWNWFWIFPSKTLAVDNKTGVVRRSHIYPTTIQRVIKKALIKSKINKKVSVHTLRHSYATHLLEAGYDIKMIQELLGHANLQTTMIYTHVAKMNILNVKSPLDTL